MRNKMKLLLIGIVAVTSILVFALVGCGPKAPATAVDAVKQSNTTWAAATEKTAKDVVTIENFKFTSLLTIKQAVITVDRKFSGNKLVGVDLKVDSIKLIIGDKLTSLLTNPAVAGILGNTKLTLENIDQVSVTVSIAYSEADGLSGVFHLLGGDKIVSTLPADTNPKNEEFKISKEQIGNEKAIIDGIFDLLGKQITGDINVTDAEYKAGKSLKSTYASNPVNVITLLQQVLDKFANTAINGDVNSTPLTILNALLKVSNVQAAFDKAVKLGNITADATFGKTKDAYYMNKITSSSKVELVSIDKEFIKSAVSLIGTIIGGSTGGIIGTIGGLVPTFIDHYTISGMVKIVSEYNIQ